MGYLSSKELALMREDAAATLDGTCSIRSITKKQDSIGALVNNGTATRDNIPCRFMAGAAGWEELVGSKPQHGNAGMFSMNGTLTLNLTDIIIYNTLHYNIRGANIQDSERMLTRVAVETANG
jgi:hypothetical protein